ncbi:hypothetical protein [Chryseolinea lacunae]|uniref:Uncharacterized protein n=1 Tax=Chryseolinea lacunae TaxID=2801331 RepID=A0ABS1KKP3_9BACT|nr:hypothetical protein [Chryseolinea lacunae]MBL0739925.1 hypothetical protein [Chryseolinea lacunae]
MKNLLINTHFGELSQETQKVLSDYKNVEEILKRTYVAMGQTKVTVSISSDSSTGKINVKSGTTTSPGTNFRKF